MKPIRMVIFDKDGTLMDFDAFWVTVSRAAVPDILQSLALDQALAEQLNETATAVDEDYVLANADVETFVRFKEIFKPMFPVMKASSGTYTPVTGVTVGVSGATNTSHSSGTVTVTAKGSGGILGFGASAKTATITVTNSSSNKLVA